MAFGTGHHESTQLCVKSMMAQLKPGDRFFDLGCGSGILCILASRLGAGKIVGVDISDDAIANALENIAINNVADLIEIRPGSVEIACETGPYDFLVANIIKSVFYDIFDQIYMAVRPGGIIVLSGLLEEEQNDVLELLSSYCFIKHNIKYDNEWIAVEVIKE